MGMKDFLLDPDTQQLIFQSQVVRLTRIEFLLLEEFLRSGGGFLDRQELMERVWGPGISVELRTVDSHIVRLRRKLKRLGEAGPTIETVWGLGYRVKNIPADYESSLHPQDDQRHRARPHPEHHSDTREGVQGE